MKLIPLTQGQVAKVSDSDFSWLNQWKWSAHKNPKTGDYYARRTCNSIYMHRLILGLSPGDPLEGDHKNGNTLDNQRRNLRKVTDLETAINARVRKDNTSGYKGVGFILGRWRARIGAGGKTYLGEFKTARLAHEAYQKASKKVHGKFRRKDLNA